MKSTALADAIRILAMDGVQAANSGHPGAPMGMAEMAVALWHRHLKHDPADPTWADRDRFVLSNGHASMLIYALLNLSGYDLPLDELKKFRQLGSKTPGHPEYRHTPGVETTTGPLGQGLANAVGMALAEKLAAAAFNRPGHRIVDHHTFVFLGDGCMMEGISHEVASLAGLWKLGKLIVLYDDNGISIDGHVAGWFADDTPARFEAYGWNVIRAVDGHDVDAVDRAIAAATRSALGITAGPFEVDAEVRAAWDARAAGAGRHAEWTGRFAAYRAAHPDLAAEFERRMAGELPADWAEKTAAALADVVYRGETIATRKASQNAIQALAPLLPEFLGGSADLAPSNLTRWKGCRDITPETIDAGGDYLHYGVREFGMTAIMNGVLLHGGFRPFGGTFLMFSEYARNALRMAALMGIAPIWVFTHDSIGVGEDGPTHQPIEQTATLRMVPNLDVWRPCDTVEAFVAWQVAVEHRHTPTALILTRQNLPHQPRDVAGIAAIRKGGYVLKDCAETPKAVILATGSEVALAIAAQAALAGKGIPVRVVSMPSTFAFERQDAAHRDAVLPRGIPRVAVEAGSTAGWGRYVGLDGAVVGIDRFGECGPAAEVFEHLGVTAAAVVAAVERVIGS
jgi:transketolase